jgi:class 3 adenylate cyclase
MGDAGLVVCEEADVQRMIFALCELAQATRERAIGSGLDAWLNVNVHVGPVIAGPFGPVDDRRYDVIGKTVNIAARLGRRGVTLSAQAFRCLDAESRDRFDKMRLPVTYRYRF